MKDNKVNYFKHTLKYTFKDGLYARGGTFAVIMLINIVFIALGSLGLLPRPAHIVAVSLAGVGVAVMIIINIVCDFATIGDIFTAPKAYLYALTPAPRRATVAAKTLAMFIMDCITSVCTIASTTILSLNLADAYSNRSVWNFISNYNSEITHAMIRSSLYIAMLIGAYLLLVMFIITIRAAHRSIFYQKRFSGLFTALAAATAVFLSSILPLALSPLPFARLMRYGMFFIVNLNYAGQIAYTILIFAQAAILFLIATNLIDRRINI